jgi:integrase
MVSVKIILDNRSMKRDGTFPLILRVIYKRKVFQLPLGYSLLEKDWDETGQKIKSSCKLVENINRVNSVITKEKQQALEIVIRLQDEGKLETISLAELKTYISKKHVDLMVLDYCDEVITQLQKANKIGNAEVYKTMRNSLRIFTNGKDFPIKQLNYTWLKKYESWYLGKGNTLNGLGVNLRTLRALFNRAIKEKRVSKDYYPFSEYSIKKEETRKRAIPSSDLELIKKYEPKTKRQQKAKDYFLLSYYLMGASFIDLAFLKLENIVNGRIEYKRKKTSRLHSILVTPSLLKILNPYIEGKQKGDFILNVIKSDDPVTQYKQVKKALKQYNKYLEEIAKACGISFNITSYVSRHSYATIAKYKGVPTSVISEALGHSSEEVTQVYLSYFDKGVMDKYHSMIIDEE